MPGTNTSGRPGGNPDLIKHQFKTERPEPLAGKLTLRITHSDLQKLKELPSWQEKVRRKISELLLEVS